MDGTSTLDDETVKLKNFISLKKVDIKNSSQRGIINIKTPLKIDNMKLKVDMIQNNDYSDPVDKSKKLDAMLAIKNERSKMS